MGDTVLYSLNDTLIIQGKTLILNTIIHNDTGL